MNRGSTEKPHGIHSWAIPTRRSSCNWIREMLKGGCDILAALNKYTEKMPDNPSQAILKGSRKGFKPIIGDDDCPWKEIFRYKKKAIFEWYVIEYDAGNPHSKPLSFASTQRAGSSPSKIHFHSRKAPARPQGFLCFQSLFKGIF